MHIALLLHATCPAAFPAIIPTGLLALLPTGSSAVTAEPFRFALICAIAVLAIVALIAVTIWGRKMAQYKKIASLIPGQAGICDEAGNILFYQDENLAAYNDAVPRTLNELPVEMQQEFQDLLPKVFYTKMHRSVEFSVFQARRKVDFYPIPKHMYGKAAVMWLSTDITELHEAFLDRSRAVQRFARTLSSIGDAVIVTNFDGEITMVNPLAAKLCGCTEKEAAGKQCEELFQLQGTSEESVIMKVIQTGTEYQFTTGLRINGKAGMVVEGRISPITEEDDLVVGAVLCFRDITERSVQKMQLQKALEFAQGADRAKSDFLATINHEFRSSLNTIIGYSELLQMSGCSDDSAAGLRKIHDEGNNLLSLLDDVLDFSKSDVGSFEVNLAPMELKELARELLRIFNLTCDNKKIPLTVHFDDDLPEIISDYKALRQILIRLISYSFAMAKNGTIDFSAQWLAPHLQLLLTVTAPGSVCPTVQELPLVKQICERLRGEVDIARDGDKVAFLLDFPNMEFRALKKSFKQQTEKIDCGGPSVERRNVVLLIDDIPVNLLILGKMLQSIGVDFVSCDSAQKAIREMEQYRPLAIFTDLWMPGLGGDELARHLNQNPRTADIPKILITADNQLDAMTLSLFTKILYKPFKMNELKDIIKVILPEKQE